MDFSGSKGAYLTRYQQLDFSCHQAKEKKDAASLANSLRNLYLHQKKFGERNNESSLLFEGDEYLKKYADIVDNMDTGGLNNFAEGALALCQYYKNESSMWETSLKENDILDLPCVKDALEEEEADSDSEDYNIQLNSQHVLCNGNLNKSSQASTPAPYHSKVGAFPTQPPTRQQELFPGWNPSNRTDSARSPLLTPQQPGKPNVSSHGWKSSGLLPRADQPVQQQHPQGAVRENRPLHQQIQSSDSTLDVNASRIGGPYANFGQKRKNPTGTFSKSNKSRVWRRGVPDDEDDDDGGNGVCDNANRPTPFRTAADQLIINQQKKGGGPVSGANYGAGKKSLGTRRGPTSKFVPPVLNRDSDQAEESTCYGPGSSNHTERGPDQTEPVDKRLKGIDPKMIELINNEIMDTSSSLTWSDIAGLEFAKKTIQEIVVWPMLRPDIFTGLRGPPKGLLLFGPPGTGKTLIGKCIASQSKSTFFCISASSLTSKWVGEGEKMVRTLFAVARCHQPAVIFIDEIDSLLSQRSDSENEASRRIKTEFLVQLDGATTESEDRILVIGATNRPQEIDEAARRRFVKRLLIPLPEAVARRQIVVNLMSQQNSDLDEGSIQRICNKTDGYSGADMTNLCREAALGPIRSIPFDKMETITPDQVRPIQLEDFEQALHQVRASVSGKDLQLYTEWNQTYGSFGQ